MFQHNGKNKVLFIRQVSRQKPVKGLQFHQKLGRAFAVLVVIRGIKDPVCGDCEPVNHVVQVVMISIKKIKSPCNAGFQPGKFGEIGMILDLMMADQIIQQGGSHPRKPLAVIAHRKLPVNPGFCVCGQVLQDVSEP